MGTDRSLTASDGFELAAYVATPSGAARGALVVAQEIFGVNRHIRSICDDFAADGYRAIAPALFDRLERGIDIGYSPEEITRGRELKARASIDAALRDIAAARDAVAADGKVGIIGYCWGGLIAWMAAARVEGFACAITYYGGGMTDAIGETPRCPVMAHFGELDAVIPLAGVEKLRAAHPGAEIHLYPAGHGFNCDQRGSWDASCARAARDRALGFLRRYLA